MSNMAKDRPPSYQWYPRDFRAEPAVDAMNFDQRGRYRWALDASWLTETYGVATEDQWREWMHYSVEEWPQVRHLFAPCFKAGRGGIWTQKRLTEERAAQVERYGQAQKGALITNEKRKTSHAQRPASERSAVAPASASASAFASATESKAKPTPIARPSVSLFDEFWSESPKKVGKKPALAKWVRLVNGSETLGTEIIAGLRRLKPTWNPGYEPNPLTFLNQERWKDEPTTSPVGGAVTNGFSSDDVTRDVCMTCGKHFEVPGVWKDHDCPECKAVRKPLKVLPWSERNGAR